MLEGSPLVQGRGLKLAGDHNPNSVECCEVAPRAGAWIETNPVINIIQRPLSEVAPRAGAWIETFEALANSSSMLMVAPRAGAWIETLTETDIAANATLRSPLVQGRGLKQSK